MKPVTKLGLMLLMVMPVTVFAKQLTPISLPGNTCDIEYQRLHLSKPIVRYATTGKRTPSWAPKHSRAWYMAALGMASQLKSYLKRHKARDPDILATAIYTGRSQVVADLLAVGFDPNEPARSPSHALPLQIAAQCARPLIMTYLLQAGADPYGTTPSTRQVAMATAVVGDYLRGPFLKGVQLLLAAGFDPRCPIAKSGVTAVDAINNGLKHHSLTPRSDHRLKAILENAVRIAEARNPDRPSCGGLNWWRNDREIER